MTMSKTRTLIHVETIMIYSLILVNQGLWSYTYGIFYILISHDRLSRILVAVVKVFVLSTSGEPILRKSIDAFTGTGAPSSGH